MSSFVRKGKAQTPGVKINPQGIPLVRTGVVSLDSILQGGLPLHSLVVVEDDSLNHHGVHLGRCFVGEGAINQDLGFVYSDRAEDPQALVPDARPGRQQKTGGLRIAWRYEDFPSTSSMQEPYYFDLSKPNPKKLPRLKIGQVESNPGWCRQLWQAVLADVSNSLSGPDDSQRRRIWIKSFLSLLLPTPPLKDIYLLLQALRTLMRSMNSVTILTCPLSQLPIQVRTLLQQQSDVYLEISSLAFSDYTGLLKIVKAPSLHSFKPVDIESRQFGLKLESKKLSVEALQLPPSDFTKNTVDSLEF